MKGSETGVPRQADEALDVAGKLRSLRRLYGFSQRELARRAGITHAMISMIEQNRASPSIASLKKLLSGFPISLSEFFSEEPPVEEKIFYQCSELLEIGGGEISLRQVGVSRSDRKLQVLHEVYEPGGDTGLDLLAHEGEEAGIIVRGQVEVTVGGRTQLLGPGDGYYFQSRLPHRFRNTSDEPCEIVSVCTPPTF